MTHPSTEAIGRYQLRRRIGSGAFATVWLAYDPEFDLVVAVKVLGDNWAAEADVRERFLSEARILRRITDPRVVRVYDVGVSDRDQPYFVMDHLAGGTVADRIGAGLEPAEALRLASECALAVQALHEVGVLHRDIKPSNLLLEPARGGARVQVSDLGTAKLLAESSGYTVTTGTPAYMAPEQAHGQLTIDVRADVYSLAVLSYELVSGRRPFDVAGLSDPAVRTQDARPAPIAADHGLPARADAVFARALATDREQRPASAAELSEELLSLAEELELAATGAGPISAGTAPAVRDPAAYPVRQVRRSTVVVLAVAVFVVSAVVAWLITQLLR